MIDLELLIENNEEILNELYVGETPFIKKLINEISKARAPYVGKLKKPIKGNKDFIKIGDMIAEEFGFKSVTFMVPYDTSMNAFTYPITRSIDKSVYGIEPKFVKGKGLKYNNSGLSTIVAVTSGVWFNSDFTDREIVAAIMHEIGHSFVLQSERMIDIIEINRLSLITLLVYQIFIDLYTFNIGHIPEDIKTIVNSSDSGKEIINQVARECANNPLFFGFNGISAITEYITGVISNLFKEIGALIGGLMNIMAIPSALLSKLFSIITKPDISVSRSQEYLSDSFATMYGLGPEISSFLGKIEYSPSASGSHVEKIVSSIPIIGALQESLKIPVLMIMNGITVHPSTPARMNKIIEELNKELNDSDLNPKTKEEIKKNIKDLEKIKDDFVNSTKTSKYNAEMVKRAWVSFINNKGEINDDLESYYTDLESRNKYVKSESSLAESNYLSKLALPYKIKKINKKEGVTINDVSDFIKNGGVNPGYRTVVKNSKDIEELQYLRTDIRTTIPVLTKIKERIKKCKELGETKETKNYYKGIKKLYIDKGITEKDVEKALNGVNETIDMINERIKELRKENN